MPPRPARLYIPALARLYESAWQPAEVVLRLATGLLLVPHGAQKLFGMFGGGGLSGTAQFFERTGYTPGIFWATFLGGLEFFGGLLLALGLFTRPVAFLLFVQFLFIINFHLPKGLSATQGGAEHVILWAAALLFFVIRGGNAWSVDARLPKQF
jgi:putative oxidoreductase